MIHHLAIAVKDIVRSHYFYTAVMGFELVKTVKRQAPDGGWTKHVFYDMGDGALFAVWDLRGIEGVQIEPDQWRAGLSTGLGLPRWINHIAFEVDSLEALAARKQRWLDHGYHVSEVDHDFIRSVYTFDPDGTMVEWTCRMRELTAEDRAEAAALLADDSPATERDYEGTFERSTKTKFNPHQATA